MCGGDGTTCAVAVDLVLAANLSLVGTDFSPVRANYSAAVIANIAAALHISQNRVMLISVAPATAGTASRRTGSSGSTVAVSATILPDGSAAITDSQSAATTALAAAGSNASSGLQMVGTAQVSATGVCGNGVCEAGEACSGTGASSCCAADCPYESFPCPVSGAAATPCGGNGQCLPASGVCACFAGYIGAACDFAAFAQLVVSTSAGTPPLRRGSSVDGWLLTLPPVGDFLSDAQVMLG